MNVEPVPVADTGVAGPGGRLLGPPGLEGPPTTPAAADAQRSVLPLPPLLRDAAAWSWRLLVIAAAAYAIVWLLGMLTLVVLPFIAALFVAALLRPIVTFFRRRGFPRALATWSTVLLGFVLLGGLIYFVALRISADSTTLANSLTGLVGHIRNVVVRDFHVKPHTIDKTETSIVHYINTHRGSLASGVLSGVKIVAEVITDVVLGFFITFFFLYDGEVIWSWLVRLFPVRGRSRIHEAGLEAWDRISGWVRGTFLIALFHAAVVGVTLVILRAPLAAPLALLVFIGSFIPIIGAVIFGGVAALVTLVDKGLIAAVILVVILLVDNQVEAHVLQPFLVGRYVKLHPLAVVLVIATGGFLEGVVGAIVALPLTSAGYAALSSLSETAARSRLELPPDLDVGPPLPADVAP